MSVTKTKKEYPVPCPNITGGPYELLHRKATGLPDDYVPNGGQCVVEPGQYIEVGLGWTWTVIKYLAHISVHKPSHPLNSPFLCVY